MKPATISWQETGEPISDQFDDIYFSKSGGLAETEYVFLQHNQLEERFSKAEDNFVIAETGFGTGLNFLAAAKLWQEKAPKGSTLTYYSAEKYPLTKADLAKALKIWPELEKLSEQLINHYPNILYEGTYPVQINDNIQLVLLFGDAVNVFRYMDIKVDAWFLDGFAPSKNKSMWQDSLFEQIAKLSTNGTSFATFTAASLVKKGLEAHHFKILKDKGFGYKREMLYGVYEPSVNKKTYPKTKPWFSPKTIKRDIQSVAIIGGGLAGCAVAYELAKNNIHSVIYEKNNEIAEGASGNPAGMAKPYLTLDYNLSDAFHTAGFILLELFLNQYKDQVQYTQPGLLELINNDEIDWYNQLQARRVVNSEIIQLLNNTDTARLADINLNSSSCYYPKSCAVNPKSLCELWVKLAGDLTKIKTSNEVTEIQKNSRCWQIQTKKKTSEYDAVVITGGYHAIKHFAQTKDIPVFASVGQITMIESELNIKTMISKEGYLLKNFDKNTYIVGATYRENSDLSLDARNEDQIDNLKILEKLGIKNSQYRILGSRASMRCVTSDHLPLIGQVPSYNEYKDLYGHHLAKGTAWWKLKQPEENQRLYIASGFGSKGLAASLLSAKLIKSIVLDQSDIITYPLKEALSPARFLVRSLKSRRLA
ncbi:bifunctional tRNA (5-methylaminomethyl-2-thiouridine)(34)-methyltransferase MnmD/FAD-dependent 5-carboxymethylaminomethyl-2-thiouridine(34) oxidoreductase MnmC [Thiotrichales bacterium 19S11-10]|nr:bifunctional tRNA (5-methylaminomethyl-2-thiouridine)(34)-methyltransferase MnmD/FAD-dependent 5-carboxymethylaminomethyl-2-thiouridine(34) oxidoreductase MnmC [Thiotrichales bacterium 19S11-10]